MGNLLYASDTEYIRYRFGGGFALNHILVEANYSKDLIDPSEAKYRHVLEGHMEIGTAVKFLKANDNVDLRNVVLLHLSDSASNADHFREAAKKAVQYAEVYIAEPGLEIELRKEPF